MEKEESQPAIAGGRTRRRVPPVQYLVVLADTDPLVWRRIQVPDRYTFWDLHVAIQDAMGWQDYHLHEFVVLDPDTHRVRRIGLPDEDDHGTPLTEPGWRIKAYDLLGRSRQPARYLYDFGDGWEHVVVCEDYAVDAASGRYPRCVAGERACPPEDCGGSHGYRRLIEALADARDPEREEMRAWAGEGFDPAAFDPAAVRFASPRKRWRLAFQETPDETSS